MNLILRLLGKKIVRHAAAKQARGSWLDARLGLALLRDRRVPIGAKLLALALGGAGMALLIGLELPLEAIWAVLLPGVGFGLDGLIDGMEAVIGPIVFGALLLTFLAPKALVARI